MFTGLIEGVGRVEAVRERAGFRQIEILSPLGFEDLGPGSSVAANGVCVTAVEVSGPRFVADLSGQTLSRTTLGALGPGDRINLERALRADSRLGGHVVQGHVDSVSEIIEFDRDGDDWRLVVGFDAADRGRLVPRGSIAVDGISLTVASLGEDRFTAAIIPHTLEHTNLGDRTARDRVNLEFDVLAKYVERLMEPYIEGRTTS